MRPKNKGSTNKQIQGREDEYEEQRKWYDEISEDPKNISKPTEQVLIELKEEAKRCYGAEVANYNIKNSKLNANYQWMKTVMSKGTVSDKIAGNTVAIQDNPVCNLENIRNLVSMVKVGKKKECIAVIETLAELFVSDLLRPDAKLRPFHQRPLTALNTLSSGNAITRRKLLSFWYFEDQLKEIYTSFILALNTVAHDTVDSNKEKAIGAMYKLLAGNPEQEKHLLSNIINKLGDPSQKVASKVIYCLQQLLFRHLNMQGVVLTEIEKLLFRTNISHRAQYYSLCFLSQYYLSHETKDVAKKLIDVYFAFFKACVKTGDIDSRMMSALLMGINRAYPYAELKYVNIAEHIDTMYRLVHVANFNISLHALTILYQVSDFGNNISDRFYGALYRKLLDPNLLATTQRAMLLSLVYKALMKDGEINRLKLFVKRLLQISLFTQPCFACGILYLISQLVNKRADVRSLELKSWMANDEDEEEKYHDVKEEVDSEQRELTIDPNEIEIKEEDTVEVKSEDEVKPDKEALDASILTNGSWHHNSQKRSTISRPSRYNPTTRNPLFGGGEFTAYTELYNLKNHFHPTVSLFALNILNGEPVKYAGDPLNDFVLIRFLDRFVFKNPKKVEERGKHPTFGKRQMIKPKGVKTLAVHSAGYLRQDAENIPVDELFVHSYLQKKYQDRTFNENDDSDLESVQSEEFEEMLDKMAGVKDDDDIDFLDEIGDSLKRRQNKVKSKRNDENESADSEEELEDDLDEDDFDDRDNEDEVSVMNDDDRDLLGELSSDDEEAMEFLSEDEALPKSKNKKFKNKGPKDFSSVFAPAEEFATLLEDEGSSKIKPGGSNAFANKDNADVKQLAWEETRNRWLNGFKKTIGGNKRKSFGNKNEKFSKAKRPNRSKFENKSKKLRK